MLLLPIFFHYIFLINLILADKNVEIDLIKNYMEQHEEPKSVTSLLCWNAGEIQKLSTILQDANIMLTVRMNLLKNDVNFRSNNIFILDLSCADATQLLFQANEKDLFKFPNRWLVFVPTEQFTENKLGTIFNKLNILFDSHIVLLEQTNSTEFSLKYIYKLRKQSDIILDQFGKWKFSIGFLHLENSVLSQRRQDFKGQELRTTFVIMNNDSFNHMLDYRFNEIDPATKLNFVLTNLLSDYLNATLNVSYVPTWYSQNKDQNNSLIGSLIMQQIDISGTPLFCKKDRLSWCNCVAMTSPVKFYFIFRQPPLSYVKNIYALPFGRDLWLTNVSFLLLASLLLYANILWEWKVIEETDETPEYDMIPATFWDALLFNIAAVCQQGYATEPKGGPGKVLILTVFFTLIFLFTAYSAYTVVLFQATADDIKNLDDLYESKIELGIDDKPYFKLIFPTYTDPLRQKIYNNKIAPKGSPPHIYPIKVGMEKVRTEYFAFHIDQMHGYKVIHDTFLENEKCGLQELSFMLESDPWIMAPKNSSFMEIFRVAYRKLQETGLNQRENKKRFAQKPVCKSQANNYRSAGLLDLYSVYMLLVIGMASAACIFLFEILLHRIIIHRAEKIQEYC